MRLFRFAAAVTTAVFSFMCLSASLTVYPSGTGLELSTDYRLYVRDCDNKDGAFVAVDVYPVKVDKVEDARHVAQTASMAYFDFNGRVEVMVIPAYKGNDGIKEVKIRPLSKNIACSVAGDTITFELDKPDNLSVEIDGEIFRNLHLFANPEDTCRPKGVIMKKLAAEARRHKGIPARVGEWIYFAPGVYELPGDTLRVASGERVFIDGGCRVYGTLIADGVDNVQFLGRGEVHPKGRGEGAYVKRSRNVLADGIIVTQMPVGGSDNVNVNNVKAISSYGWGDGMNVFASNNVHYNNVFCRNSDDCSTIYATRKGFVGGCENITMENSTLWADVAHPIMIGLHGSATEIGPGAPSDTIRTVVYRNIDVLDHAENQFDYQGVFGINCGDNNVVRDLLFDDIRVEDFRKGALFVIRIPWNRKYCKAPGRSISNITFKDIVYNGTRANPSVISGYDEERTISDITFDNLVINGVHVYDDMPGKPKWYKTSDFANMLILEHVDNVVFK